MTEEQIEAMDILEYPQFCTLSERRKAHDFIVQELDRLNKPEPKSITIKAGYDIDGQIADGKSEAHTGGDNGRE